MALSCIHETSQWSYLVTWSATMCALATPPKEHSETVERDCVRHTNVCRRALLDSQDCLH